MAEWVSFDAVKQQVSIYDILQHYGLVESLKSQKGGDELVGICPFHGETKGSLHVSLSKNAFRCFGCKRKGNILDFVMFKEGSGNIREAALLIADWFQVASHAPTEAPVMGDNPRSGGLVPSEQINPPLGPPRFPLRNLDAAHPYLAERGLGPAAIECFGLGYASRGLMTGRIAIPIHNELGKLIAYCGRWTGEPPEERPKYLLPSNFHKSQVIFNMHRAMEENGGKELIIVEGFFGLLHIWQAGFQNVVALMGSELYPAQKHLLQAALGRDGRVVLLLDNDEAGQACQQQCIEALIPHLFVKVAQLPEGVRQPDELKLAQLERLLAG